MIYCRFDKYAHIKMELINNNNGNGCAICCCEFDGNIYITECNHKFDLKCILLWINSSRYNKLCPICRSSIDISLIKKKYGETYTTKYIDRKLDIEGFLKLPGVKKLGRIISLDLSQNDWIQNMKGLVILYRISSLVNPSFSKTCITIDEYKIVMLISWVKFCVKENWDGKNNYLFLHLITVH